MGTRQWGRLLILTAMIAAVTMIGTSGVSAHAQFKSADPAPNATVNKAPTQIMLVFSEETSPTKSGGSVTDASGATVSTGFKVDLNARTNMAIALKPNLPNGVYTVQWNTLTEDDNAMANGTFAFTIQAAAASAAATGTTPAGASAVAGTAPASVTVTTAPTIAPTVTPAATTAPTATTATTTRATTTVVATGVGGGATTGTATTLPATGTGDGGIGSPWVIWAALLGAFALVAGLGVRTRAARSRR